MIDLCASERSDDAGTILYYIIRVYNSTRDRTRTRGTDRVCIPIHRIIIMTVCARDGKETVYCLRDNNYYYYHYYYYVQRLCSRARARVR